MSVPFDFTPTISIVLYCQMEEALQVKNISSPDHCIIHTSKEWIGNGIGSSSDRRTSPPKKAFLHEGVEAIKKATIRNAMT